MATKKNSTQHNAVKLLIHVVDGRETGQEEKKARAILRGKKKKKKKILGSYHRMPSDLPQTWYLQ